MEDVLCLEEIKCFFVDGSDLVGKMLKIQEEENCRSMILNREGYVGWSIQERSRFQLEVKVVSLQYRREGNIQMQVGR